jgi:hypothetical protein
MGVSNTTRCRIHLAAWRGWLHLQRGQRQIRAAAGPARPARVRAPRQPPPCSRPTPRPARSSVEDERRRRHCSWAPARAGRLKPSSRFASSTSSRSPASRRAAVARSTRSWGQAGEVGLPCPRPSPPRAARVTSARHNRTSKRRMVPRGASVRDRSARWRPPARRSGRPRRAACPPSRPIRGRVRPAAGPSSIVTMVCPGGHAMQPAHDADGCQSRPGQIDRP